MKGNKSFGNLLILFIITFHAIPFFSYASNSNSLDHEYNILKINNGNNIEIDGQLNEEAWQSIKPINKFTQREPFEGEPVSELTEAYIFYDDEYIYFGFKCYDSEPEKIIARVDTRDARTNSDEVTILIDTYHDLRNGFVFSVNAAGIQTDACVCESNRNVGRRRGWDLGILDSNWNGIWKSAAQRNSDGWIAEIAIPFKSLRFTPGNTQTWGLNIQRTIARKNEVANWYPVKRYDRIMKPSKAGQLSGIKNVMPGRNLQFIPFTVAIGETSSIFEEKGCSFTPSFGLNIKYGITSNLTADIAFNPDFGQTEVDVQNVRLSKYELFYPEKREFFTEGADIFKTPLQLFFSRRIGRMFSDYSEHNILVGGKITGRLGNQRIGIIEAFSQDTSYYDTDEDITINVAQTNFFIFRIQRDIFKKSNIGFITVNRDQQEDDEFAPQRAHGLDLNLVLSDHLLIYSQFAFSSNIEQGEAITENTAFISGLSYDSNILEFSLGARNIGEYFDISHVGYFPRTDRLGGSLSFAYKPYLYRFGIRQLTFRTGTSYYDNHDGFIADQSINFNFGQFWENFWYSGITFEAEKERYYIFFEGNELDDETLYIMKSIRFYLFSSDNHPVVFRVFVRSGDYIDYSDYFFGKRRSISINVDTKPTTKIQLGFNINLIKDNYSDGTFQENRGLLLTRLGYAFNKKLRFRVLTQYNLATAQLITDSLISYDFNALSGLYIGFRDRRNLEFRDDPEPEDTRFFFKISYLLAF